MNKYLTADDYFLIDIPSPKDITIKQAYKTGCLRGMTEIQTHPSRAHWIRNYLIGDHVYMWTCSKCGKNDKHRETFKVPYCWNCGAKMDD